MYDRQAYLYIRSAMENNVIHDMGRQKTLPPPPFQHGLPAYLCRTPYPSLRRMRQRWRGKCGGLLVKVKAHLVRFPYADLRGLLAEYDAGYCFVSHRSLESVYTWLVPVVGSDCWLDVLALFSEIPPDYCPLYKFHSLPKHFLVACILTWLFYLHEDSLSQLYSKLYSYIQDQQCKNYIQDK